MKEKIPYSLIPFNHLKKISHIFLGLGTKLKKTVPDLELNLKQAEMKISPEEYIAMSLTSSLISFIFINIILTTTFLLLRFERLITFSLLISLPLIIFIFFQQTLYPKLRASRKIKDIDRNLLPALQNMLVQINSGVPLFTVITIISKQKYGEVSKEFSKAIKKINAGFSQTNVLDDLAKENPSPFFRRSIWQLVNGMKTGSDIGLTIKEIVEALSEEQLIQIQRYGAQLNPLAMFYMLISIILPSLGITFLVIISSFIAASESTTKIIFGGLYILVLFFQIMFLGIIKTKRPTLLET